MKKEKIIIANWKMKLGLAETVKLSLEMKEKFSEFKKGEIVVCPNFISLLPVKKALQDSRIKTGAQDSFWEARGAYTGEISPDLLIEAGCDYVIIGHSERRQYLLLNYEIIHRELRAVLNTNKLTPIVCIGESLTEKKEGQSDRVIFEQLQQALTGIEFIEDQQIVIAYEPIWAIGTDKVATPAEVAYAHKIIRLTINDMFGIHVANHNFRIVYGGSVSSKNVHDFIGVENVDGFLVGGASLDADEFYKIAKTFTK